MDMASGLTPATVIYLMNLGRRQTDIAEEYGVSRQYVNKLAKKGGHDPVVTVVTEHFPWPINEEMYPNTIYQALRLFAHWRLDPLNLSESSKEKVRAFLRKIRVFQQVVDYDPAYPAIPGISNTPGFAYVPRKVEDKDYVIRLKPGVKLTTLGEEIWRLPEETP